MKFTISNKLLLSFAIILVVLGGVNVYSLFQVNQMAGLTADMYDHPLVETRATLNAKVAMIAINRDTKNALLAETDAELEAAVLAIDEQETEALKQLELVRRTMLTQEGRDFTDETTAAFKEWKTARDETIALIRAGDKEAAITNNRVKGPEYIKAVEDRMNRLTDYAAGRSTEMLNASAQTARNVLYFTIVALVIALIAGGVLAYMMARSITVPLQSAIDIAGHIAKGNLRLDVGYTQRQDEVGDLARSLVTMIANLREQIQEIVSGSNLLASSISQISATTSQLTTNSAETATAVSETTTTIEEVRQTSQMATEKAKYVSEVAAGALQKSQVGREASITVVNGMKHVGQQVEAIAESIVRLSEQSQAIGEIITTVDDVAEQSNLLAVNAAIEAAKAGEHGKGFGVVAQEIRSLAEQSKQATTQVRRILTDIQKATGTAVMATEQGSKAVEAGLRQTAEASAAIMALAESVMEASQSAVQIAASSQQQLVGMDQVAQAMENINQASTQNVEGALQLRTAAQTLESMGQKLKSLVTRYVI